MPSPEISTITPAPPAPLRSQAPALYTMTAESFVDWQGGFPAEMNTTIADIEAMAAYLEGLTGSSGPITATALTMATNRLLGRYSADTGAIEEISIGSGLSLDAGTLSATATTYTDEQARDAIGAALVAGTNVTITADDGADTITIDAAGDMLASNNLSDVADVDTAQENLGFVVVADQAAYDALTPDAGTFYFVPEA